MDNLEQIIKVAKKHHLMTLATVSASDEPGQAGLPWVAHAFYAWVPELIGFVFTTDPATRHGSDMVSGASDGARVAAGIALETRVVGRVQGIQIEGTAVFLAAGAHEEDELSSKNACSSRQTARRTYLKRFPYAAAMDLKFWLLEPTSMKLTDNTLGFGTKIVWTR